MKKNVPFVEMHSLNKDEVEIVVMCNPGVAHSYQRDQINTLVIVQVYSLYVILEHCCQCTNPGGSVLNYVSPKHFEELILVNFKNTLKLYQH